MLHVRLQMNSCALVLEPRPMGVTPCEYGRSAPACIARSRPRVRPNPSLEATATGLALGPRTGQCHHPSRGPSANPASAPQLKR